MHTGIFFDKQHNEYDCQNIKYDKSNNIVLSGIGREGVENLRKVFGSENIAERSVPQEIFRDRSVAAYEFIEGLIAYAGKIYDADSTHGEFFNRQYVKLELVSKELALQVLELCYLNHRNASYFEEETNGQIKYCVFFLIAHVTYLRMQRNGKQIIKNCNVRNVWSEGYVSNIKKLDKEDYGYSVVTESGHFDASGVQVCDYSTKEIDG